MSSSGTSSSQSSGNSHNFCMNALPGMRHGAQKFKGSNLRGINEAICRFVHRGTGWIPPVCSSSAEPMAVPAFPLGGFLPFLVCGGSNCEGSSSLASRNSSLVSDRMTPSMVVCGLRSSCSSFTNSLTGSRSFSGTWAMTSFELEPILHSSIAL